MEKIEIKDEIKELSDIHQLFNESYNILVLPNKKAFTIDCSNLRFVSPIGAISLLLLFEKVDSLNNFNLILPKNEKDLVSYIERINFFKYCPSKIMDKFKEHYDLEKISSRRRHDKRKVLLEITKIKEYEDIDTLFDSVLYILNSHNMSSTQVNRIASIVSELGTNILDHSGSHGYVAVQYYPKFNKVMIGIADNGIGIVNKIRCSANSEKTDLDMVKKAFLGGYTSVEDIERGWGLTDARDHSYENAESASFQLRTQNGVYEVQKEKTNELLTGAYFPGTYYLIEINFRG